MNQCSGLPARELMREKQNYTTMQVVQIEKSRDWTGKQPEMLHKHFKDVMWGADADENRTFVKCLYRKPGH